MTLPSSVPAARIDASDRPICGDGQFVLYWMTAFRRLRWNHALDRAIEWAAHLRKPLVIVETLCCGRRWDSDRHHRFVLEGMAQQAERAAGRTLVYHPFVEPKPGAADRLLAALAPLACVVIADDYPAESPSAAFEDLPVRLERIDGNGMLPLSLPGRVMKMAFAYRRFLHQNFREHGLDHPETDPLAKFDLPVLRALDEKITKRFPAASAALLAGQDKALAKLVIDHSVAPVDVHGGAGSAETFLHRFVRDRVLRYHLDRNEPEAHATSELSPYLHYGMISVQEVFWAVAHREKWNPGKLSARNDGRREGWWGMREGAEAFVDQLAAWREVGYNLCHFEKDMYDRYESLPDWAQVTLAKHAADTREHLYTLEQFEAAATHDPLWNAAQRQLMREGNIHNYMRMLWGKKILEWSSSPQEAASIMIELNNKYALDGRDPNSYSGIFWTLGRYDRAWGPERNVLGKIRFMASENTARKHNVKGYLVRYGEAGG